MPDLLGFLIQPFAHYGFMRQALLTAVMVGSICSILSCILVLKRWSLLGDAISHAVLPGVAIAYALGLPYFIGALFTGALSSMGISYIQQRSRLKEDTAMGIVFTGAFALGVALIGVIRGQVNLYNILFGNILTVTPTDFWLTLATGVVVITFIFMLFRAIVFWTFDPTAAEISGIPVRFLHCLVMFLLTATIVASLRTVGIVMVVAMLITPGATGFLLAYRLPTMIAFSLLFGNLSAITGLYISYYFNLATGAVMVLVATFLFALVFLFSPCQGLLVRRRTAQGRNKK